MKLVFVNRFFYPDLSATSQILSDLAFFLAENKTAAVHVVAGRLRYDDPSATLAALETVRGVTVHRVFSTRFGRKNLAGRACDYLSFYVSAFLKLLFLLKQGDVAVPKTDPPLVSLPVSVAARLKGARTVNWLQDLYPEVTATIGVRETDAVYRVCRFLRNRALRSAFRNVVIGERMARRLLADGVSLESLRVIPNWTDGEAICPVEPSVNRLRREWGLEGKFVVGYSGNMGRVHGFDAVLEAAAILKGEAGVVFLFIGDGSKKSLIEREQKKKNLPNLVFQPYQPAELLSLSLGAADAHLVTLEPGLEGVAVPSKFYGVLAAGRPVLAVGDPCGEVGAIVTAERCGFAVSDGPALAASIRALAGDEALRRRMALAARSLYDSRFNRAASLGAWTDLVKSMFAGQKLVDYRA